eukprot:g4974.t1
MRVLVLLSPAKTLNWAPAPASLSAVWSQPKLLQEADAVVEVMRGKSKSDLKKLMSVSDSIAELNLGRFRSFAGSAKVGKGSPAPGTEEDIARPAALAYDGPAYRGLDAATFSEEDWAFGAGSVRLLSGLYGVLRPGDLIQPYRLEMGSRVGVAGKKDLYEYWKEDVATCLLEDVQKGKGSAKSDSDGFLVVNVASQEYSKAVDFDQLERAGGKVVTCVFKDDGRVLSVFAKRARGLFARHVVVSRAEAVADLEAFSAEGYGLDRSQSKDGLLVFTRSKAQREGAVPPTPAKSKAKTKSNSKAAAEAKTKPKSTASSAAATRGRKRAGPAAAAAAAATALAEEQEVAAGGSGDVGAVSRGKRAASSAAGNKSAPKTKSRKKT